MQKEKNIPLTIPNPEKEKKKLAKGTKTCMLKLLFYTIDAMATQPMLIKPFYRNVG